MGLGAAVTNPTIVDAAVEELRAITVKAGRDRARKAIASFQAPRGLSDRRDGDTSQQQHWEFIDPSHHDRPPAYA